VAARPPGCYRKSRRFVRRSVGMCQPGRKRRGVSRYSNNHEESRRDACASVRLTPLSAASSLSSPRPSPPVVTATQLRGQLARFAPACGLPSHYFLSLSEVLVRECLHLMQNTSRSRPFAQIGAGRYGPRHVLSIAEWTFCEHPIRQQVAPFRRGVRERHELQRKQYFLLPAEWHGPCNNRSVRGFPTPSLVATGSRVNEAKWVSETQRVYKTELHCSPESLGWLC
jgi:hypothetical protein